MVVASLLPSPWREMVRRAAPTGTRHLVATTATDLTATVRAGGCTYVVVDPAMAADCALPSLAHDVARTGGELLLVGRLTRRSVTVCLAVQHIRPTSILFSDVGELAWLRNHLCSPGDGDVAASLLHRLRYAIGALPVRLRVPTVGLFSGIPAPRSIGVLARRSGMSGKSVQRWYTRVGLRSPPSVVAAARLAVAWRLARNSRLSMARVATLAGFGSARTLTRTCNRLAVPHPPAIRQIPSEQFTDCIIARLLS